jgi:glycosyltransferase involved in cell wall biosynthesis
MRVGISSGIGMTAWYQIRGLVNNGVQVDLYCVSLERSLPGLNKLYQTLVFSGVKVPIRLVGKDRAKAFHDRVVSNALRKLGAKYDLIHCWPTGSLKTLKAAKEVGICSFLERPSSHTRYVFDAVQTECEELDMRINKHHYTAFDQRRLEREEQEFELSDWLLCPSQWAAGTFIRQGIDEAKIVRHRYGYDPEIFGLPENDCRASDDKFRMLFVGRGEPRKGLHYALEAWLASKACKNGSFYICGEYVPGYREAIADKLSHPTVKEMGFRDDVSSLMQQSHALVVPSISEGSALVTYESRACGCVLLVSEASGAHCEHMHDALIHPIGDVEVLRDQIDSLASNRKFFRQLRQNSIAGLDNLTWEKAGETLVSKYQESLKKV